MSREPSDVPVERVLDASALLAHLHLEPGAEAVELRDAAVSAVNWCEVVERAARRGGRRCRGVRRKAAPGSSRWAREVAGRPTTGSAPSAPGGPDRRQVALVRQ